jgi:hypothetical protein
LALDEYNRLSGKAFAKCAIVLPGNQDMITLAAAAEKYFANTAGIKTASFDMKML